MTTAPAPSRSTLSREAAWLIALAVAGTALKIPLIIWFRSLFHSDSGHRLLWYGAQVALVCLVPFALRLNAKLGLPGAPLIEAKLAGRVPPARLRSLIGIAVVYDLVYIVVGTIAAAALVLSGALPIPVHRSAGHASILPAFRDLFGHLGGFVWLSAFAAIGAGVSEEILFRLSMFAISIWLFRAILGERTDRPSRTVLWCATIMQGYVFGLPHLLLRPALLTKVRGPILIVGLAAPQTWAGIILGRLYLRRGLEATMIAHAILDVGLFLLMAVAVYLLETRNVPHVWVRALTTRYG